MDDGRCVGDVLAELSDVMGERDENEKLFKGWRRRCLKAEKKLAEMRVEQGAAGDLAEKYEELLADRDRLRLLAVHALGYSADFLVMILCTVKSLEGWGGYGPEFADKIEELADEVEPVTEHEQGTAKAMRDSLASAREILQGATRRG